MKRDWDTIGFRFLLLTGAALWIWLIWEIVSALPG